MNHFRSCKTTSTTERKTWRHYISARGRGSYETGTDVYALQYQVITRCSCMVIEYYVTSAVVFSLVVLISWERKHDSLYVVAPYCREILYLHSEDRTHKSRQKGRGGSEATD